MSTNIRGIEPLCNLTLGINSYLIRAIKPDFTSKTSEDIKKNWNFPSDSRFDSFITTYFKNKKRCYFYGLGYINTLEENLWIPLNEAKRVNTDTHIVEETRLLRFPTSLIDNLSDDILKTYKFIDLTNLKINSKADSDELLSEIAKLIDLDSLKIPQISDLIVGIKVHSKFIGEFRDYPNIKYNNINIILFDNNPVYEEFIKPGNHEYLIIPEKLK